MNCYETIFILHPQLGEDAVAAAKKKVDDLIESAEGRVYHRENWGSKRLAYEVAKQSRGNYQLIRFVGNAQSLAELERLFRLDEDFIKFLTVRLKQDPATAGQEPETAGEQAAAPVAAGEA